jgi:CheY-like chemotaxis protein
MDFSSKGATIFVIDDDEDDFLNVAELFEEMWPSTHLKYFMSSFNFCKHLSSLTPPGLIILDINMPIINGFGVLRILKRAEQWKRVPVIIFSTSSNPDYKKKAVKLGATAYMKKPVTMEQWQIAITKISTFDLEIK